MQYWFVPITDSFILFNIWINLAIKLYKPFSLLIPVLLSLSIYLFISLNLCFRQKSKILTNYTQTSLYSQVVNYKFLYKTCQSNTIIWIPWFFFLEIQIQSNSGFIPSVFFLPFSILFKNFFNFLRIQETIFNTYRKRKVFIKIKFLTTLFIFFKIYKMSE